MTHGDQKIAAELHEIGGLRRLGNDERLLSDRVEERCRGFDRVVLTCGYDEELARSREVGAAEHRRRDEALASLRIVRSRAPRTRRR